MPMYNLVEYSDNYSETSVSLWQYYEPALADDGVFANFPGNSTSFKYKQKVTGSTGGDGTMVALKYLSNFGRTLEMPLINCEISFILT